MRCDNQQRQLAQIAQPIEAAKANANHVVGPETGKARIAAAAKSDDAGVLPRRESTAGEATSSGRGILNYVLARTTSTDLGSSDGGHVSALEFAIMCEVGTAPVR